MDLASDLGWHEGEKEMQDLLHVPPMENPTSNGLAPYAMRMLHSSPLLALGILDEDGRPWTTLLGGKPGFARLLGRSTVGVKTLVDTKYDPVLQILFSGEQEKAGNGEVHGRLVSGLAIDLATRSRVKLAGRIAAGALGEPKADSEHRDRVSELQMAIQIEQSLGKHFHVSRRFARS